MLILELLVPFLVFGPRRAKLLCFALLSGFQVVNAATANYGFFVYLALALHVFLLADRDVAWITTRLPRPRTLRPLAADGWLWMRRVAAGTVMAVVVAASAIGALLAFGGVPRGWIPLLVALQDPVARLRLVNTYHLFGHITRERIEPEIQLESAGNWRSYDLRYKPGAVDRRPPFVAPHQPRVDFQLWFYGLGFRGGTPPYVAALLERLCRDPAAVQPLFRDPLPPAPDAVRIAFWQYRFTAPGAPAWWARELLGTSRPISCR